MKNWIPGLVSIFLVSALLWSGAGDVASLTRRVAAVRRGNLVMPRQADLYFGVAGNLKEILVAKGDRVVKGQALARLDDSNFRDTVRKYELQLEQDQKTYELAQLDFRRAQEQLDEAAPRNGQQFTYYTDYGFVQTNIVTALNNVNEALASLKTGDNAVANGQLQSAQYSLNTAMNSNTGTLAVPVERGVSVATSLSTLRQLTYLRDKAQITTDKARITPETTRFLLEQSRKDLLRATLSAPFDGIISDISRLDEGSPITTSTKVFHVADPGRMEINASLNELDVSAVKAGQQCRVIFDALPDVEIKGEVAFSSPVATVSSSLVSYPVTITLAPLAAATLRDGLSASASILIGQRSGVLLVPRGAIGGTTSERTVELVIDEKTLKTEKRPVTVGLMGPETVEILSGLKEGEKVVVIGS
jgi:multidrug efflux pump subunit AcrA (membrane-fusion protein)